MEQKIDINIEKNCVRKIICLTKEKKLIIDKLWEACCKENHISDPCHLLPFEILWENKKYMCIKMNIYKTLPDYLSEHDFSLLQLCTLAACMCHAVIFLHEHHILHMDIKPGNIFLTGTDNSNPDFLLGDFDSAALLKNNKDFRFLHNAQITPAYAAPELYMKGRASTQSDFYSLGKTLRCLLPKNLPRGQPDSAADQLFSLIHSLDASAYTNRPQNLRPFIDDFLELRNRLSNSPYHISLSDSLSEHGSMESDATHTVHIKPLFSKKIPAFAAVFSVCVLIAVFGILPVYNRPAATENNISVIKSSSLITEPSSPPAIVKPKSTPSPAIQKNKSSPPAQNAATSNTSSYQMKKTLNLEGKNLMDISELQALHTLKNLYLGNNQIIDISPLESFCDLKRLYLNSNLITDLLPLKSMYQLEILLLQDNNIENIQPISGLYNLKHLDISNNPALSDINALSDLTNLEFLNLIGTNVSEKQKRKLELALPNCTIIR